MMIGKSKLYQVALFGLLLSLTVNLARAAGPEPSLVKDIYPGTVGPYPYNSSPNFLTDVNGTLFFIANDDPTGNELWKSDGTEAGTVLIKDIYPGAIGSLPANLTNVNGTLFFSAADDTTGDELWGQLRGQADGRVCRADVRDDFQTCRALCSDERTALVESCNALPPRERGECRRGAAKAFRVCFDVCRADLDGGLDSCGAVFE